MSTREQTAAHNAVSKAVMKGELVAGRCEHSALSPCQGQILAHHDDYTKPLEVRWLCRRHHSLLHQDREPRAEGGEIQVKTRLSIHLHALLTSLAERNQRSLAAELRLAIVEHLAHSFPQDEDA